MSKANKKAYTRTEEEYEKLERRLEAEQIYSSMQRDHNEQLTKQLDEALKLAEEAIQHYEEADSYSSQFFYDVDVMLRDALKKQLKEQGEDE